MDTAARGRTRKSFCYVVRAPGSEGFDVMNVDLKIDTAWLFQDADDAGEKQGNLLEGVARAPGKDTGMLRGQVESSEQKLPAAVDEFTVSESGLRSRIQELELSEQRLLRKVDQLNAQVAQERSASLQAQRQLEVLQGQLASQVREQERVAGRLRERLRLRDQALGRQAAALERSRRAQRRQLGLAREQESELRAQVRQLERDVRRLCNATSRLLTELDAAARPGPQGRAVEAAEDAAARRRRGERATEPRLGAQLDELRCCVYELKLSEIRLQGQVEDLTEQNRSLQVELGAKAPVEKAHGMVPAGHCSLSTLGCIQDEFLPLPREEAPDPSRGRSQQSPLWSDGAGGQGSSAGQLAEGPCAWGCAGAGRGPPVLVPGRETMGALLGDLTGSDREQLDLALLPLDEQTLLLVCCCPPRQCVDGSLLPVDLPQPSEQISAATLAQGPFLLVQTSSFPVCWSARDLNPLPLLLLPAASPETSQIQEVLDTRPPLAPEAAGHPGRPSHQAWGHGAFHQESPRISNPQCPGKGPESLKETLTEGEGAPGWGVEPWEAKRTLDGPRGECPWRQDASGTQASSQGPWLEPPRQREASGPEGNPESLSGRGGVQVQFWSHLGGLWSKREEVPPTTLTGAHGTEGPSLPGGQLWTEKGRAGGRGGKDKEEKHPQFGSAELLWEESPGEEGPGEEQKGGLHQECASLGLRDTLEKLDAERCHGRDLLFLAEEKCWPGSTRLPWPAEGGDPALGGPWAPGADCSQYGCMIDTFEEEMVACFQQLPSLQLGSRGPRREKSMLAGENRSLACKWPSREDETNTLEGSANRAVDVCSAQEAALTETGEAPVLGATGAPGAPPGQVPGLDGRSPGGNQFSGALEQVRRQCSQLIARLKKERSVVLLDYARLRGDQERSHRKVRALERERERRERRVSALEQDNHRLSEDVSHLQIEVDQYLQLISDLEDCNGKSYRRISELESEKEALQGKLGQTRRAMSESTRRAEGVLERATRENTELWALVSELGVGYQGLIQDIVLGTEDVMLGLRRENTRLLCRVLALEQGGTPGMRPDTSPVKRGGQGGQPGTVDKAIQVAQLTGQRLARVGGLSWEEGMGQMGGQGDPSSGAESLRRGANSPTPSSAWGNARATRVLRENIDGAGVEAGGDTQKRLWCSGDQGQELQGVEAEASEEGLRLRVGQLHHQVLTLKCWLRDQGSLHRELQASREETGCLRKELQDQLTEFQKRQHEASLAVTPLKAKVASLVQKCLERNNLITHLLQELHQRGAASPLLAERTRSMVDDVALAEYAATFLTTGVREISHPPGVRSEKADVVRAQRCSLNPEGEGLLPSPPSSESRQASEADWPPWTASLKIPVPPGLKQDPWMNPAAGAEKPGFLAQHWQGTGGNPCPALHTDGLPPHSELQSPARILALHKELRQSICSNSRVNKSPLDLQV